MIANRGLELGGHGKGEYEHLSPNDDVNRSQSTNDTYPTALKLAVDRQLNRLVAEMELLEESFSAKAVEFSRIIKVGRTQLQDAVPMTLGQEFGGFATMVRESRKDLEQARPALRTISLGATAIGTGIAADPQFAERRGGISARSPSWTCTRRRTSSRPPATWDLTCRFRGDQSLRDAALESATIFGCCHPGRRPGSATSSCRAAGGSKHHAGQGQR